MKRTTNTDKSRIDNLALSKEDREQQLIAKAERLAERQLEDGTASPNVIVHYLKLATAKEAIERDILERQKELITAKTEALQSAAKIEALYEEAMSMFKKYNGTDE